MKLNAKKTVDIGFDAAIIIKAIDGFLQMLAGVLLLFFKVDTLHRWLFRIVRPELAEDPRDRVANWVMVAAQQISFTTKEFYALLFIAHGLANLLVVTALALNKKWAYPVGGTLISAFVLTQGYRLTQGFSWGLAALTALDIAVLFFIWEEYRSRFGRSADAADAEGERVDPDQQELFH